MERLTTRYDGHAVMAWEHEEKYTTSEWIDMLTDRLAAYEDTGLEPEEVEVLIPPPNDPLTLNQLRKMDGEPVWVANSSAKKKDGFCNEWALISVSRKDAESVGTIYHFENYGDYWLAYRRKLEGDKDNVVQIS